MVDETNRVWLFRLLSRLLGAGLPLAKSLRLAAADTGDGDVRDTLRTILDRLDKGSDLSSALREIPQVFPQVVTSLIALGERSGRLDSVCAEIAAMLEEEGGGEPPLESDLLHLIRFLSLVVDSGIPLHDALDTAGQVLRRGDLRARWRQISSALENQGLGTACSAHADLLGRPLVAVLETTERSGMLDRALRALGHEPEGSLLLHRRWRDAAVPHSLADELKLFFYLTALLAQCGSPLGQALEILAEALDGGPLHAPIKEMRESFDRGGTLAAVMQRHPDIFTASVASLVFERAEQDGSIDGTFRMIAEGMEQGLGSTILNRSGRLLFVDRSKPGDPAAGPPEPKKAARPYAESGASFPESDLSSDRVASASTAASLHRRTRRTVHDDASERVGTSSRPAGRLGARPWVHLDRARQPAIDAAVDAGSAAVRPGDGEAVSRHGRSRHCPRVVTRPMLGRGEAD